MPRLMPGLSTLVVAMSVVAILPAQEPDIFDDAPAGVDAPAAQPKPPGPPAPALPGREAQPTAAVTPAGGPFRALAPGVEITIRPNIEEQETYSVHDIVELTQGQPALNWQPRLSPNSRTLRDMARAAIFRRDVWCLEVTFKPVRMIYVDVPQPSGKMQRKLIWYLLYHVKNTGGNFKPIETPAGTYDVKRTDAAVRFIPKIWMEAPEFKQSYPDRVIPVAIAAIQQKEDPRRTLLNSVEIAAQPIPVSSAQVDRSVWAVATWEDVDPRVDYFAIYIQGLTNAYRWLDAPAFKPGSAPGTGRNFSYKTLMLNFWRPGEVQLEVERPIRYGAPGKIDYDWVYR